jgi:hypothetical protein
MNAAGCTAARTRWGAMPKGRGTKDSRVKVRAGFNGLETGEEG